jgi:hypothetical protein
MLAERPVDAACRSAIHSVHAGKLAEPARVDAIVQRGERLRDLWWPELAIVAIAIAGGQLALWRIAGGTGVFHGGTGVGRWSFPRLWYVAIALPLAQLVMFRWLWRWAIWGYMLVRLARLPLSLLATHPDRSAGLACLARPLSGFSGFAAAIGAVLAGAWETQILAHRATLESYVPALFVLLVAMLLVAIAPLLAFCGHLFRVRRKGLAQYGDFASGYTQDFHAKWIERNSADEAALGSQDIQALNDLGGAFQVVVTTRLFAFGMRPLLALWAATIVPMIPLFASAITIEELLKRIVNAIIGGLPL